MALRHPGPTEVTVAIASGTRARTRSSMIRVCASTMSSRVPFSISPFTRTWPSSLGGRNSVPMCG